MKIINVHFRIWILFLLFLINHYPQQYQPQNILVESNVLDQHETAIAVDPTEPLHLMATWNDFRAGKPQSYYGFSTDGGLSWSTNKLSVPGVCDSGFDPSCAFDNTGNAYYGCISSTTCSPGGIAGKTYIAKTSNDGQSWSYKETSTLSTGQDKPYLTIDNTGGLKDGRIYICWTDVYESNKVNILFRYSTDHGTTFQPSNPVLIATKDRNPGPEYAAYISLSPEDFIPVTPTPLLQGSVPAVAPNGDLYVVWFDLRGSGLNGDPGTIKIRRSTDGGNSFGSTVTAANISSSAWKNDVGKLRVSSYPSIAISPLNGTIYIAYTLKSGSDLNVYYVYSTNSGSTWSTPAIATESTTTLQFFPWLSASPNGTISLVYYQGTSTSIDAYLAEIYPGDNTFYSPNTRITPTSSNPNNVANPNFVSDYIGTVSTVGNMVYPCFAKFNSSPANSDIYIGKYDSGLKLAHENKSINQAATGQNNGRRLVKDGSGNYHIVFASGGEIFYRKINGGTSWQTPIRLSNGNGNNNYPSVSESGGRIYATWQRNTSGNNYDIYFAASTNGGTSWNTKYVLNSVTTTTEPLPTIQAASSYEMVVFCYGSGIKSYWSYYTVPSYPSYWTLRTVGFSTSYSPTITSAYQSSAYYFPMAIANSSDNHIYYYYFNPSTTYWNGGPNNLSSIVPGSNTVHLTPSITSIPGTSQIHVAWKKLIGSGSSIYDHLIIHRRSTNYYSWPNEWFGTYYNKQENPSISALATNKVDLLYHTPSQFGTQYIYKMRFNGSNWGSPTSMGSNSGYPSVSSGSTTSKYVWTSGSGLPYTVMLSSETLQKELEINPLDYYTRSVSWLDSSGSYLEIRLNPVYLKMKDGTKQRIDIMPASLDTFKLTQENSWGLLSTVPFQMSSDAEEVIFDYSISAEGVDKVLSTNVDNIQPVFNLLNSSDQVIANSTRSHVVNSNKLQELRQQFTMPLNSIDKTQVLKAEIKLNDLIPKPGTFASLGHIYDYSALEEGEKIEKIATKQVKELSIQNFPNPFNPNTTIGYQMPKTGFVTLKVYDVLGREIQTLVEEEKPAGTYAVNFNAVNLASGIYFYTITTGEFSRTKKMILLR